MRTHRSAGSKRPARHLAVAVGLTALALTGCGGSGDGAGAPSSGPPAAQAGTRQSAAPSDLPTLPLDQYRPNAEDRYALARAEATLTNGCLAEFGVRKQITAPDLRALQDAEAVAASRLYGITDRALAESWGYDLPPAAPSPPEPDFDEKDNLVLLGAADSGPQALDPSGSPGTVNGRALPPGGCLGAARQRLYGSPSPRAHFTLATDLAAQAWQESRSSTPVGRAVQAWRACMSDRGLRQDDPLNLNLENASPELERATAVADVDCKATSRLVPIWRQEDIRAQQDAEAAHAEQLASERAALGTALARAAAARLS